MAETFQPAVPAGNLGLEYCARLTFRRPMLDINAAKAVTGWDECQVLEEIHLGRIRWAFNLGTSGKNYVLILARSLQCFNQPALAQPETVAAVADVLLPAHTQKTGNVRGSELQFAFNVSSQQMMRLMRAGLLVESGQSRLNRGPSGSPLFTRASVVEFLRKRRYC